MNFPKYHFLSLGSFGYFEGKLKPILEYDDLKPEVFQNFREIGNTVMFMKDLSDSLDIRSAFEFINLAPYVAVAPDTTAETLPKLTSTALGAILNTYSTLNLNSTAEASVLTPVDVVLTGSIVDQLPAAATSLVKSISSSLIERKSLFRGILSKVEECMRGLNLFTKWGPGKVDKIPSIADTFLPLNVEQTKAFHKVWSALSFLYCLHDPVDKSNPVPEEDAGTITDEEEFGHGFTAAGCLFIHLLGQRDTHEALDFSIHVLKVFEFEFHVKARASIILDDPSLMKDTESFIAEAITHRKIHDYMFALFEAQFPSSNETKDALPSPMLTFHPNEDI